VLPSKIINFGREPRRPLLHSFPILYAADEHSSIKTTNGGAQTTETNKQALEELAEVIDRLCIIFSQAGNPIRICGRRTNCCSLSMISLFHENK